MVSKFLLEFAQRVRLNDIELVALATADVRSDEEVDSLVRNSPSLTDVGVRLSMLFEAVAPRLSAAYRDVVGSLENYEPVVALGQNIPEDGPLPLDYSIPMPDKIPSLSKSPPALSSAVPLPEIDLRLKRWPVRNQGDRGTCVAFGATACVEHLLSRSALLMVMPDYSEQFLYWAIKTHSGDPHTTGPATFLRYAREILDSFGICEERLWRYVPTLVAPLSGRTASDPSSLALSEAARRKLSAPTTWVPSPTDAARTILRLLVQGKPVAVGLKIFGDPKLPKNKHDWVTTIAWSDGRIANPNIGWVIKGGHCVCVTGFYRDEYEEKGGFFVFRNSWGPSWARLGGSSSHKSPEVGYGYVSASYVDKYCVEILQL